MENELKIKRIMNESEVFLAVFPEAALSDFSAALALNTHVLTALHMSLHHATPVWPGTSAQIRLLYIMNCSQIFLFL